MVWLTGEKKLFGPERRGYGLYFFKYGKDQRTLLHIQLFQIFYRQQLPVYGTAMAVYKGSFFIAGYPAGFFERSHVIFREDQAPLLFVLFRLDAVAFYLINDLCSICFHTSYD